MDSQDIGRQTEICEIGLLYFTKQEEAMPRKKIWLIVSSAQREERLYDQTPKRCILYVTSEKNLGPDMHIRSRSFGSDEDMLDASKNYAHVIADLVEADTEIP